MSDFRFLRIKMKVTSVNVRQELHGDEHRLAMDIGLEFNQANASLDKLDSRLLQTFYWKNPSGTEQAELDGVERVTDFPNLRFEHLIAPVKWAEKFEDGLFVMHHGDDDSLDLRMPEVKINEIKIWPKEGGTTTYNVRVQAHPDEEGVARMCTALQSEIIGTVDADPQDDDEPEQPPADEEKPKARKGSRKGKQTDAFDDQRVADIANAMKGNATA